jgi:triosephosphate isomerase (TIM)
MRRKIVAGNWKMNTLLLDGKELAEAVKIKAQKELPRDVTLIIAPPLTHLAEIKRILPANIGLAAQNCASEESGAYTGEVSAAMIASTGAKFVIIGHSERRQYYGETDAGLNKKIKLAMKAGLSPIFCCGENLHEREKGIHTEVVRKQIELGLEGIGEGEFKNIIIAYEPVWAIGTGKTATPEQAQDMHKFIRTRLEEMYGTDTAANASILYGGSCNPSNAKTLFANQDVDGGLIGGASLKSDDFLAIARSF